MICIWSSWCHHPTISCFIKIKIGLIFLVPAYSDCHGKKAVKQVPSSRCIYGDYTCMNHVIRSLLNANALRSITLQSALNGSNWSHVCNFTASSLLPFSVVVVMLLRYDVLSKSVKLIRWKDVWITINVWKVCIWVRKMQSFVIKTNSTSTQLPGMKSFTQYQWLTKLGLERLKLRSALYILTCIWNHWLKSLRLF